MARRTILLSPDGEFLYISSEYNDEIRLTIKSFSGAQWASDLRVWCVPVGATSGLLAALEPFDFVVSEEVRSGVGVSSADGVSPNPTDIVPGATADETLSVVELSGRIQASLASRFERPVWVRGELFSFDRGVHRQHWFFELVEKSASSDEIAGRVSAVVFSRERARILVALERAGLRLCDGLEIRCRGRVAFYAPSGRLQLVVDQIDPTFSLGQIERRRREVLEALARADLLERNRSLPTPDLPLRVGLITAPESDAYHDVIATLSASGYPFIVGFYPVTVQGQKAEASICEAVSYFTDLETHAHVFRPDIILIVRGGGSRSDLAWLDTLAIGQTVATCPVKVVVGIGHERDRAVLDVLAQSCKTPTAAAEWVVEVVSASADRLTQLARRLEDRVRRRLSLEHERVRYRQARLGQAVPRGLANAREHTLGQLAGRLSVRAQARLQRETDRLVRAQTALRPAVITRRLDPLQSRLAQCQHRLDRAATVALDRSRQQVQLLSARIIAADPNRHLERGFAIVRSRHGHLVRRASEVEVGEVLTIRLQDGTLAVEVRGERDDRVDRVDRVDQDE